MANRDKYNKKKNNLSSSRKWTKVYIKMGKRTILYFSILFPALFCNAQNKSLRFSRITVNDGLSQSTVNCIFQDRMGYMWFGTDDGLNKYDGIDIIHFKYNSQDTNSVCNSTITNINEDSYGNLWIGTAKGLSMFDRKKNAFVKCHKFKDQTITSILPHEGKNMMVSTRKKLIVLNSLSGFQKELNPLSSIDGKISVSSTSVKNVYIMTVFIDRKKNIWIGTNHGLCLFDIKNNNTIDFFQMGGDSDNYGEYEIRSIFEDHLGRLWIGHSNGLILYENPTQNYQKARFIHFKSQQDNPKSITSGDVLAINEDCENNLWVGISNGGLNILNLNTFDGAHASFLHCVNIPSLNYSLGHNSIYCIYSDNQKNMWVGTYGNGVSLYTSYSENFGIFKNDPFNPNSLTNNQVFSFLEDNDYVWIGTASSGITRYRKQDRSFSFYSYGNEMNSGGIWAMLRDESGDIWLGTWASGLKKFNPQTGKFINFLNNPSDTNTIASNNIFAICKDRDGNLWFGTMGGGLNMYDRQNNRFIRYMHSNSGIMHNYVESIVEDKNGELWMSNLELLSRFNRKTKKFKNYINNPSDIHSISGTKIHTVFYDSRSNLWIGTDVGLNLYIPESDNFISYQLKDGLPDNSVKSICEDNMGNLWLGTNKGLCKFFNAIYLPKQPKFKNYTIEDGLQSNEFNRRSCIFTSDSCMFFGGENGFNIFYPDKIKENTDPPNLVFTDFMLFNSSVTIGDKRSPLSEHISQTKSITLNYYQSIFSIHFVALNYVVPSKNQYAYKMEGFDKNWNYVGKKREASYTNLDPGEYIFTVIAANNDGYWNKTGISIKILVLPPWWKTLWFKILFLFFILSIFSLFYYIRFSFFKRQRNVLEEMVYKRTFELEETTLQLEEQQEEINQQKEELLAQRDALYKTNLLLEEKSTVVTEQNKELFKHRYELESIVEQRTHELIAAKEKAEESDRLKSSFLANLSHEIRTPLNAIMGFSSIISENILPQDEIQKYNQIIQTSGISLLSLIDDIIDFSKIESGYINIVLDSVPLKRIIDNISTIYDLQLKKQQAGLIKQIEYRVAIGQDIDKIVLMVDEVRLNQILSNLINNAIKFTNQGFIEVGYSLPEKSQLIEFYVKDTGIGIKEEHLQFIFQRFRKVEDNNNEIHRGAGLGLAISQQLVNLLGGTIHVESELSKGSTFFFTLPLSKDNHIKTTNGDSNLFVSNDVPDLQGLKIVIAEDDDANFAYIQKLMQKTGCQVFRAINGIQVLLYIEKNIHIALILMDIKMPVMNGIDALREIRKRGLNIPVMAQTAHALEDEVIVLREEGFDEYITKPINSSELYFKINKILKKK